MLVCWILESQFESRSSLFLKMKRRIKFTVECASVRKEREEEVEPCLKDWRVAAEGAWPGKALGLWWRLPHKGRRGCSLLVYKALPNRGTQQRKKNTKYRAHREELPLWTLIAEFPEGRVLGEEFPEVQRQSTESLDPAVGGLSFSGDSQHRLTQSQCFPFWTLAQARAKPSLLILAKTDENFQIT